MASPLCPDPDAFACESASAPQRRRKPRLIHMPRQPLPQLRNRRRPLRLLGNRSDSCKHNPNQNATSDPPNSTAISYEHEFVLALQCCNVNAGVTTAAFGDWTIVGWACQEQELDVPLGRGRSQTAWRMDGARSRRAMRQEHIFVKCGSGKCAYVTESE